ncbi:hypothetical protein HDU93_007249 [Gonapodya sp. JEL0774]|nr:hypothetical protein HDU93_007249 [Gonapodya sp. JEL0774]
MATLDHLVADVGLMQQVAAPPSGADGYLSQSVSAELQTQLHNPPSPSLSVGRREDGVGSEVKDAEAEPERQDGDEQFTLEPETGREMETERNELSEDTNSMTDSIPDSVAFLHPPESDFGGILDATPTPIGPAPLDCEIPTEEAQAHPTRIVKEIASMPDAVSDLVRGVGVHVDGLGLAPAPHTAEDAGATFSQTEVHRDLFAGYNGAVSSEIPEGSGRPHSQQLDLTRSDTIELVQSNVSEAVAEHSNRGPSTQLLVAGQSASSSVSALAQPARANSHSQRHTSPVSRQTPRGSQRTRSRTPAGAPNPSPAPPDPPALAPISTPRSEPALPKMFSSTPIDRTIIRDPPTPPPSAAGLNLPHFTSPLSRHSSSPPSSPAVSRPAPELSPDRNLKETSPEWGSTAQMTTGSIVSNAIQKSPGKRASAKPVKGSILQSQTIPSSSGYSLRSRTPARAPASRQLIAKTPSLEDSDSEESLFGGGSAGRTERLASLKQAFGVASGKK